MTSFAEQLQAARLAADLSQESAADRCGRSLSTYRKWEQGVNTPHAQIQALALAALKDQKRTSRKSRNDQRQARAAQGVNDTRD